MTTDTLAFEATDKETIKAICDLWEERRSKTLAPLLDHIGREHITDDENIYVMLRDDRLLLVDGDKSMFNEERMKSLGFRHGKSGDYKGWYASSASEKGRKLHNLIKELCPWHPYPNRVFDRRMVRLVLNAAVGEVEEFVPHEGLSMRSIGVGALHPERCGGRCLVAFRREFATSDTPKLEGFTQIKYSEYVAAKESAYEKQSA